ncbi:MAG TPA: CHAT domain-containing protein [Kofleriaceae bacterium]|jgi:tetratricopeptide (TPR) repeat protein|nr:CHAT domain-containing protein [Kofleriaceae bacterium]
MSACEKEIRFGDRRRGIQICLERYSQNQADRDLAWAAKGYLDVGEIEEADKLAHQLLAGPMYGDANRILSYVALRQGSDSAARMHAEIAYVVHTLTGEEHGRASDAVSLAQAAWKVGDFTASLTAADEALRLSLLLRDPVIEVRAQLARVDALRRMGDHSGAIEAVTHAIERATAPCDQAWAHLKSGLSWMEAQQDALAMSELADAAQANQRCRFHDVAISIALNEAWLLRRRDPAAALTRLDKIAASEGELFEVLLLRGYLAADRGDFEPAERYFTAAESLAAPDADWRWEIMRARAELSELRGGPWGDRDAESHYRRAIANIAALRTTAHARSAYFVASHRGPYDGLIALLARHGRWRDILAVVLELDASDMLRATADEQIDRHHEAQTLATPSPSSVTMPPVTVEDVLSAWRSRDLVIVIAVSPHQIGPGLERAYRLRITDGQVTGEDVGDASTARTWAGDLFENPENRDAARGLGQMIVPPGLSDGTLHVLAIGALGKVPLAALRDAEGALSIARRPLVRVLGLRANGPESQGAGPASIIADPRGDLPSAAVEGSLVAAALGSAANASGAYAAFPATRERLWAAHDAALLHIAGHVGKLGRWRALRLADGEVGPSEIVEWRLAPHLAVLAGCGSAAAWDEEGWGSIAAALLESGTALVIATDRSVDDLDSLSLMRDFYRQPDWRSDPARALARVQQVHAATTRARSWAAFSVLGRPPVVAASTTRQATR